VQGIPGLEQHTLAGVQIEPLQIFPSDVAFCARNLDDPTPPYQCAQIEPINRASLGDEMPGSIKVRPGMGAQGELADLEACRFKGADGFQGRPGITWPHRHSRGNRERDIDDVVQKVNSVHLDGLASYQTGES